MRVSHSRVDLYKRCHFHYRLKYIDKFTQLDEHKADSPLTIGNALHYGLEVGNKQEMIDYYYSQFPVKTDKTINEAIKLELAFDKVMPILNSITIKHQEYVIEEPEFKGIVDLITENDDGTVDIFDFKYSNNVDSYMDSPQLHIYQYYLEQYGFKVNRLGYIFIPKLFIRQKKNEDLDQFRKRLVETYKEKQVQLVEIPKDEMQIVYFFNDAKSIQIDFSKSYKELERNINDSCFACKYGEDYLEIIEEDDEIMALPKNEKRELKLDLKPDFWIYADSYVGKSTFVDSFDDVLFINTDGNTDNTTSPVVSVRDHVTRKGRIEETQYGWEDFKNTVTDLGVEENSFQAVAIDLVEDLYELCRTYVFNKNNIEHESDSGFGKGWDLVKKEFVDTMKRLKALKYQLIFISKENRKEIKERSGASYTTFSPNLQEKQSNILSGIVDLTIHAEKDGEKRYINLITDEHTFGGGRFDFKVKTCELNRKSFEQALKDAQKDRVVKPSNTPVEPEEQKVEKEPEEVLNEQDNASEQFEENEEVKEEPQTKTRRRRRA